MSNSVTQRHPCRKVLRGLLSGYRNRSAFALLLVSLALMAIAIPTGHTKESLRRSPVVAAIEKASPAVVNVSTTVHERVRPLFPFSGDDFFKDFFPDLFAREYTRTSLGSGVIIDGEKGHIITNHHVVAGAEEIKVITSDQKEFRAGVLGSDPRSDLAVLRIETGERLPDIPMGKSDDLMIGESVIAIGNPFGLSHTVTTGVISAVNRSVRSEDHIYRGFIQTDASINPGNSGGPLLNVEGDLIGINTAIYQKAQGIGFAIPIDKARRIVNELIRSGEVRFPWIGAELQELTPALRGHFRLPGDQTGVLVSDLFPDSPASRGGLRRGDILLAMEGMSLSSLSDYREILAEFTPRSRISLRIFRKGAEEDLSIELAVFPPALALDLVERRLGIRVREPDDGTRRQFGISGGVMIQDVRPGSEAARIGLRPGDMILKVKDTPMDDLETFKKVISRQHQGPSIRILVQRGRMGYNLTLPF